MVAPNAPNPGLEQARFPFFGERVGRPVPIIDVGVTIALVACSKRLASSWSWVFS